MKLLDDTQTKKQTMRRKLFGYMLILVVISISIMFIGFFHLGHYTDAKENLSNVLSLQMEVFKREIATHQEGVMMRNIKISDEVSNIVGEYLSANQISFSDLENSQTHLLNLQQQFKDILETELPKSDCSGAFIILNTTVNSAVKDSDVSRSCVYIQRNSNYISDESLLLFRGNAQIAGDSLLTLHRKWKMEFNKSLFPDFDDIIKNGNKLPLEKSYSISDVFVLPGTSERVMLLTMPIRSETGFVYGICGFEISSDIFKINHAQPSTLAHLVCTFSKPNENLIVPDNCFVSGVSGGYHLTPHKPLTIKSMGYDLSLFKNDSEVYVGISTDVFSSFPDRAEYQLSVMIPKYDYDKIILKNTLQTILFMLLVLFFAVTGCSFFSRRYLSPILGHFEKIKTSKHTGESTSYAEIDDLFEFIAKKESELAKIQSQVDKLSYSRKTEIQPDDYKNFILGIKTLTKAEQRIFECYLAGLDAKGIVDTLGIKESTLKYHNRNIYEKLGVSSKKEMLKYAVLYAKENNKGNSQK